ncbi:Protein argonaute 1A [Dichanthelium oligosanthes]|uniref:Protein argonaute 1A n=1 Tax=Dichanthelium oligosanthes TaxID=888268 RepID=A0A1E5VH81_9POAL|nr:Protein argonaute 1A [Dichanthelium oligosanthes]
MASSRPFPSLCFSSLPSLSSLLPPPLAEVPPQHLVLPPPRAPPLHLAPAPLFLVGFRPSLAGHHRDSSPTELADGLLPVLRLTSSCHCLHPPLRGPSFLFRSHALIMTGKGTKLRRFRLKPKRKQRGLQDMFDVELALVRDGNQKDTTDSGHALEDEVPSGTSRIVPEVHADSLVQYQAPTSQAIPPLSSLKAWVRSHKCLESGTFGQRCTLKTNHFVVTPLTKVIHQYDVCITPKESCRINRVVMVELLKDVSSALFIKDMPVISYIAQLLDRDILDRPLCGDDHSKINKAIRGMVVKAPHKGRMTTYRVLGLTRAASELCVPSDGHGTAKAFVDYFQEKCDHKIKHTDLPCLEIRHRRGFRFLPMEVCRIAKQLRYSKQLNRDQISALLEVSRLHPGMREDYILEANNCNFYNNLPCANEFGIKFEKKLLSVDARVLPPPWLKFHDSGMTKEFLPQVGRWNMIRKRMFHGGVVRNWTCVNFSWEVEGKIVSSFCHELAIMCQASGMDFSVDPVLPVVTYSPENVEWTLKSCLLDVIKMIEQQGRELDLLIVILPNNKGALYGDLKTICETDIGLVSQCCLAKHVLKMRKQYLANVALKINVKVGGKNTVLLDAFTRRLPCVGDIPTIILGAHVMHPGKSSSPSIAAVVASQDWPVVTNYAALANAQANGQELIQNLFHVPHDCKTGAVDGGMIKDAVSNQQLYQVMWQELVAIKKACSYLEPDYKPAVTYVVLQKFRRTCFFPDYEDDESFLGSGNVLPAFYLISGTVVDSDICHPNEFGFYLCSQVGTQGTTRPVYYRMLWDENRFTADTFQCLTNYLCYTYARCTHSISIVPPVRYAHLMASRGRMYMESTAPETRGEGQSPSSSRASSSGSKGVMIRPIPVVKDNVKRVMFYC